jgi:hypothetical protein
MSYLSILDIISEPTLFKVFGLGDDFSRQAQDRANPV